MRKDRTGQRKALKATEEAAEWLHELKSEDSSRHEDYLNWLLESPLHVEAFLRVSAVDASLGRIDAERSIPIVRSATGVSASNVVRLAADTIGANKSQPSRRRLWALAAGVAFAGLIAAGGWATWQQRSAQWTHYVTATGEQRAITLEDGSLLHINTGSRVDVRYSENERVIHLLAGEALFRVHQESTRPFRVYSGETVIQAIGTQFNVLRRPEGSTVSVIEGRVRVNRDGTSLFLDAGEEARVNNDGSVAEHGKANLSRVNAWRQRRLMFMNETLGAIASEFNRYNRAPKIEVEGPAAALRDYEAMSFNADDPESLLAVLEKDPHLEVERRADRVIVRQRLAE